MLSERQPGSLAHTDDLCKPGCLSTGKVWASAFRSTFQVDVRNVMVSLKTRAMVFGTGSM